MKKKCKRKVRVAMNPIEIAIAGARLVDQKALNYLRQRELSSLESITKGKGTRQDWQELADVMNITQMMALHGIGPEALEACDIASVALVEAKERFDKTGKMGLSGIGLAAIRDVLEYAQLQQSSIARSKFEEMIDKTLNHLKSKSPLVKVLT